MKHALRIEDVAKRLNISKSTVERKIRSGEIPSMKIGRLRRIRAEDLEAYELSMLQGG